MPHLRHQSTLSQAADRLVEQIPPRRHRRVEVEIVGGVVRRHDVVLLGLLHGVVVLAAAELH